MTTNLDDLPQSNTQSSVQSNVQLNITEQNVKMDNPIKDLEQRRNEELKQAPGQTTGAPQPATAPQSEGNQIDINSFVTGLHRPQPMEPFNYRLEIFRSHKIILHKIIRCNLTTSPKRSRITLTTLIIRNKS